MQRRARLALRRSGLWLAALLCLVASHAYLTRAPLGSVGMLGIADMMPMPGAAPHAQHGPAHSVQHPTQHPAQQPAQPPPGSGHHQGHCLFCFTGAFALAAVANEQLAASPRPLPRPVLKFTAPPPPGETDHHARAPPIPA